MMCTRKTIRQAIISLTGEVFELLKYVAFKVWSTNSSFRGDVVVGRKSVIDFKRMVLHQQVAVINRSISEQVKDDKALHLTELSLKAQSATVAKDS